MSDGLSAATVVDLTFELGQLKRLPRAGWRRAGVEHPETVAAHNLRAAQLAYLLAVMEGHPDPNEVCTMVVFHEVGEARIGDIDKVAGDYLGRDEERAVRDQLAPLGAVGQELLALWLRCEHRSDRGGDIAKDADKLELAFTAREYMELGFRAAGAWIDGVRDLLVTESAKAILVELESASFTRWWGYEPPL